MNTRKIGDIGEEIARDYLYENGFNIIHKNFRCKIGEIDIIAKKDDKYYVIEVKSRRTLKFGSPKNSVTYKKLATIKKVAEVYIKKYNLYNKIFTLNVIEVTFSESSHKINFIKNIFL